MKHIMTTLGALMATATPAMAAGATETEGMSLITVLLIGVGGMVVVGQLIPATVLFHGILKGLFGHGTAKTEPVTSRK